MKKILFSLALMSALLVSCEKPENGENNPEPTPEPEYSISISPAELTFGAEGGEQSVTVTSSEGWYLDGESDWCEVSASYGSNGDKVTFSADPYENTAKERTATFIFYCGDKEVKLVVTQEAKVYSISVEPKELTFEVEGGKKEITITSSENWSLSEAPEWITLSENEGENGAVVTVTVEYNNETDIRSGDMIFICGDKDAKVIVTQQADDSPIIQFKDPYFLAALLETYTVFWNDAKYEVDIDKNNDGQISEKEAASVEVLDLEKAEDQYGNDIRNADELKYFTSLKYLTLSVNKQLTSLDLSKNTALTELYCNFNQLTSLDVSGCAALKYLNCDYSELTSIDVSGCAALEVLLCYSNQLTSLDVSGCAALEYLELSFNNQLTSLDVSGCAALKYLNCYSNQLTSLDLSKNTALTELSCGKNQLTSLDLSNNTALTSLSCSTNQLTSLDLSNNTALTSLYCSTNQLTSLDLTNNTALTSLSCSTNQLTSLDLSNNTALTSLYCSTNQLTSLDLTNNTALERLECYSNDITSLDVSMCRGLEVFKPVSRGNSVNYDTKLPLESLKIYKYHIIDADDMSAIEIVYGDIIEYVE